MTNTEINRYEKENKTQGEITMNNIQKDRLEIERNISKLQARRYEKAVNLVQDRDDLDMAQKQYYIEWLRKDADAVMNHPEPDADYGSTISITTDTGKVIRVGEGDTNFSSIDNRLWSVIKDYALATPKLETDQASFYYAKAKMYDYKIVELYVHDVDLETLKLTRVKKEFVFTGWELSDKVKSWRVTRNR